MMKQLAHVSDDLDGALERLRAAEARKADMARRARARGAPRILPLAAPACTLAAG